MNLSKTKLSKIVQMGRFLGRLLGPLLKTDLPLMKNVFKALAKSVLIPLRLIAAVSATDAAMQKKIHELGMTTILISNKEMKDIIKIVKSLKESSIFVGDVSETIENEAKQQKGGFLSMLFGILSTSFTGSLLTDKGMKVKIPRRGLI